MKKFGWFRPLTRSGALAAILTLAVVLFAGPAWSSGGGKEKIDPAEVEKLLAEALETSVKVSVSPVHGETVAGVIVIDYKSKDQLLAIGRQILCVSVPDQVPELQKKILASVSSTAEISELGDGSGKITIYFSNLKKLGEIEKRITGWKPPLVSVTGFALMLLSIAVIPLVKPHWWEHNKNRAIVSVLLGVPIGVYVIIYDGLALVHSLHEYEQFIILLASLFVISGGILLTGDVRATPKNNVIFLAIGSVLASFIGTTGAAMLLIRPLITTNRERKYVMHTIIFFIFCVANIGGSLTPLGDPPLFLGYLRGVEFTWTFKLWKFWLPAIVWLLALYFFIDTYLYNKKETAEAKVWDDTDIKPIRLKGALNFLFLFGVVLSIYFYPDMKHFMIERLGINEHTAEYVPIREVLMIIMAVLSWVTTKMEYRKAQNFTWGPILEVAILFAAIFVTMIPALVILNAWGPASPIKEPWHFFWITGGLSSFLDNAPTYLTFFALGSGQCAGGECANAYQLLSTTPTYISNATLTAIAVGAVFMGAMTYIGNAPNFMVKSISEENKIKMPSFFGYMAWSIGILIPTFIVITLIAFR